MEKEKRHRVTFWGHALKKIDFARIKTISVFKENDESITRLVFNVSYDLPVSLYSRKFTFVFLKIQNEFIFNITLP